MSKRNLTLLIIGLAGVTLLFFAVLFFFPQSKTAEVLQNVTPSFFPFGKTTKTNSVPPANISNTNVTLPSTTTPSTAKLKKISSFPVAGFGTFQKETFSVVPTPSTSPATTTETTTSTTTKKTATTKPSAPPTQFVPTVRYININNGTVYQTRADQMDEQQITSTVIPQIHEAFFGGKASAVAMRYLKEGTETIETFLGALPVDMLGADTSKLAEVKGNFLPENITDMSVSPDGNKIFYLFGVNDGVVGITAGTAGDQKSQIFNSFYTEWLSQWPNARMITLTTKPAATAPGYMYAIDPQKKDFNSVLSNINGLTTLTSPSGRLVLYSSSTDSTVRLNLYHTDTDSIDLLGVKTLPEKCVWAAASDFLYCAVPKSMDEAAYPDDWYKGLVSFSDEIWKIDVSNGNAMSIADPISIAGEPVDGVKLGLDDTQKYLFFINKKDSYLWELAL